VIGLAVAASLVLVAGIGSLLVAPGLVGSERSELALGVEAADVAPTASSAGWTMELGRSRVAVLRSDTDVRALPAEGDRAGFELVAGAVRVDATMLHVLVAGQRLLADQARFELTQEGEGFELRVQEGVVRFGERELGPGTHFVFSPGAVPAVTEPAATEPTPIEPAEPEAAPAERTRSRTDAKPAKPKWRALVQSREWAEAYTEMKRADPKSVRSSVDALMAAADAARFGGHPDEAPSYLEEVIDDYARHPMAPLAAFTLGRVHLE
jgi:hypothetical protein